MDNYIADLKKRNVYKRVILLLIALFMSSIIYNLLLLPVNLVTGGSGGIATITHYVYGIDPAIMIFFISTACAILSLLYLGTENTAITILAGLIYPLFIKITSPIASLITIDYSDLFIITIYAGILNGITNGIMYKTGYSNGGLPIINQILNKTLNIPIATASAITNTTIVIIGGFFFGWTNVMYAIIFIYLNTLIINKVLLGISNNKAFYIITKEEKEVKDYIINMLDHNATIFNVKGGFLDGKEKVILTVIPTKNYYQVTEGIRLIDKEAFFVVTDAYEVSDIK